jgi:predicted metal-dependent peptidase
MSKALDFQEYQKILNSLVNYHAVFYQFWRLVKPCFSEEIDTACVSFNNDGKCVEFLINREFWNSISETKKQFVICHECIHVINSHGKRGKKKLAQNIQQANCAMDIVVNESLVKYFGFSKKEIDPKNEYVWFNSIFKNRPEILRENSFEYYLNKIIEENIEVPQNSQSYVNNHSGLDIPEDFAQKIINSLSDEEADILKNIAQRSEQNSKNENNSDKIAGSQSGNLIKKLEKKPIKQKSKWETIIKRFERSFGKEETTDSYWASRDRRMYNIISDICLPSEIEFSIRKTNKDKIKTYFFMDTSGSCQGLAQRFFDAANSINKDKFDVEYYCFDTQVYKVNMKDKKLFGFGGTSFRCISDFVYKNKNEQPFVWVLTDGYGDHPPIPEKQQEKWSWFLTQDGCQRYIPKDCKTYLLENFE